MPGGGEGSPGVLPGLCSLLTSAVNSKGGSAISRLSSGPGYSLLPSQPESLALPKRLQTISPAHLPCPSAVPGPARLILATELQRQKAGGRGVQAELRALCDVGGKGRSTPAAPQTHSLAASSVSAPALRGSVQERPQQGQGHLSAALLLHGPDLPRAFSNGRLSPGCLQKGKVCL